MPPKEPPKPTLDNVYVERRVRDKETGDWSVERVPLSQSGLSRDVMAEVLSRSEGAERARPSARFQPRVDTWVPEALPE